MADEIIEDEIDEKEKDLNEQKGLLDAIAKLLETQGILASIGIEEIIKEGSAEVKEVVDSTRKRLEELGVNLKKIDDDYKKNSQDKKGILEEYEFLLNELDEEYKSTMKDLIDDKAKLEASEQKYMIKLKEYQIKIKNKEIDFTIREKVLRNKLIKASKELRSDDIGDVIEKINNEIKDLKDLRNASINLLKRGENVVKRRIDKTRKSIKKCENDLKELRTNRTKAIKMYKETKNEQLIEIPKQSILKKIIGGLLGKFNGTKKFNKQAIDQLKLKINMLKKVTLRGINKGNESFKDILKKGKDLKMEIVKSMNDKIIQNQKEIEERRKNLHPELTQIETKEEEPNI